MNNVHTLPSVRRTVGRRRERPMPGAPMADVVSVVERLKHEREVSLEEQVENLEEAINEIARHLLMAVTVITDRRRGGCHE